MCFRTWLLGTLALLTGACWGGESNEGGSLRNGSGGEATAGAPSDGGSTGGSSTGGTSTGGSSTGGVGPGGATGGGEGKTWTEWLEDEYCAGFCKEAEDLGCENWGNFQHCVNHCVSGWIYRYRSCPEVVELTRCAGESPENVERFCTENGPYEGYADACAAEFAAFAECVGAAG